MNPEMKDGLAGRLRICAQLAGSGDALAEKARIPRRTLENYLSGESEPKVSRLVSIARAANVSLEWLASGVGPMQADEVSVLVGTHADPPQPDTHETVSIPRLKLKASAGRGLYASGVPGDSLEFPRAILQRLQLNPKHAVALQADGPSMEPTIGDGDWMIADTSDTHVTDGRIYVLTIGDEAFVKRLFRVPGGGLVMRSDNRELFPHDQTVPPEEHVTVFARVKWTERQL